MLQADVTDRQTDIAPKNARSGKRHCHEIRKESQEGKKCPSVCAKKAPDKDDEVVVVVVVV